MSFSCAKRIFNAGTFRVHLLISVPCLFAALTAAIVTGCAKKSTTQAIGVPRDVVVNWSPSHDFQFNKVGGKYRVSYGSTPGFTTAIATVDLPWVSGSAPTTYTFSQLPTATYYIRVASYSPTGGINPGITEITAVVP